MDVRAGVSATAALFLMGVVGFEPSAAHAQQSPDHGSADQGLSQPVPPPPRPQRPQTQPTQPTQTPGRISPTAVSQAPPPAQPIVVTKVEPTVPTHLFSLEPVDLILFGTLNVEYELIIAEAFGLAIGGRARLWSPFGGQFNSHSLRFAPRVNITKKDAISFIAARFDYTIVESNQRCEGDFVSFCGGDVRHGYAIGLMGGANVLFAENFFGTLAFGLSYSSLDNPEWTLFNPDFRFVFKEDPNLSGDLKTKGRFIPYIRLALGFYL